MHVLSLLVLLAANPNMGSGSYGQWAVFVEQMKPTGKSVTVEVIDRDEIWLSEPQTADALVVSEPVRLQEGGYGFAVEIKTEDLRNRDAIAKFEVFNLARESLGIGRTELIEDESDWTRVTGYVDAPSDVYAGLFTLHLKGLDEAPSEPIGKAGFRKLRIWRAPTVEITGPEGSILRPDQPLRLTLNHSWPTKELVWAGRLVDESGREIQRWQRRPGVRKLIATDLPLGYLELQWEVTDSGDWSVRSGRKSFVVLERGGTTPHSPFGIDAGLSLLKDKNAGQLPRLANVLRRSGLKNVRDRFRSGKVYPPSGRLDAPKAVAAAKVQAQEGLIITSVLHDLPQWMAQLPEDPRASTSPASDLRQVHALFEQVARSHAGSVAAWEIWNEPDIFFFGGRPEEFAGLAKAAFLGIKKGNPKALAIMSSLTLHQGRGESPYQWGQRLLESGALTYADRLNWHSYSPAGEIPSEALDFAREAREHGANMPLWLTETGEAAPENLHGEIHQASDLVKRYALAATAGVERVFGFFFQYFRLPDRGSFGVLREDLSPTPSLPALAALTRHLGRGTTLGREPGHDAGTEIHWFDNGQSKVAMAWSSSNSLWPFRSQEGAALQVFDWMGRPIDLPTALGLLPVYVENARLPENLDRQQVPSSRPRNPEQIDRLGLVLDLRLLPINDTALGSANRKAPVRLQKGEVLAANLDLYNFSTRPANPVLEMELPPGWIATPKLTSAKVEPGDRIRIPILIEVGAFSKVGERSLIRVEASANGFDVSPVVAEVKQDETRRSTKILRNLSARRRNIERWTAASGPGLSVKVVPLSSSGGIRLRYVPLQEPGKWGFATLPIHTKDRLAKSDALRLPGYVGRPLIVQVEEEDGSLYRNSPTSNVGKAGEPIFPWAGLVLSQDSTDENNRLDLGQIKMLRLGLLEQDQNPSSGTLDCPEIELVRYLD